MTSKKTSVLIPVVTLALNTLARSVSAFGCGLSVWGAYNCFTVGNFPLGVVFTVLSTICFHNTLYKKP